MFLRLLLSYPSNAVFISIDIAIIQCSHVILSFLSHPDTRQNIEVSEASDAGTNDKGKTDLEMNTAKTS